MEKIKSISETRLIVEGKVNDKTAYFLIDTGASAGLMDYDQRKDYDLEVGNRYYGTLVGAGGELNNVKVSSTFAEIGGKTIPQFLLAGISEVVKSIKQETGVEILGIIGLSQMSMIGMNIDVNSSEIWFE